MNIVYMCTMSIHMREEVVAPVCMVAPISHLNPICFTAYPPEAIPPSYSTTPTPPTSPMTTPDLSSALWSCNFDQGICGFKQSASDQFDWTRASGKTASTGTGQHFLFGLYILFVSINMTLTSDLIQGLDLTTRPSQEDTCTLKRVRRDALTMRLT